MIWEFLKALLPYIAGLVCMTSVFVWLCAQVNDVTNKGWIRTFCAVCASFFLFCAVVFCVLILMTIMRAGGMA